MLNSEQPPTREAPNLSTLSLSNGMQRRSGRRGSEQPQPDVPSLASHDSGGYYRSASAEGSSPGTSYEAELNPGYEWTELSSVNTSSGSHSLYLSPDSFQFPHYPTSEAHPSSGPPHSLYYPSALPTEPPFEARYEVEQLQHPGYYSAQQHRFSQFQVPDHLANTGQAGYPANGGYFYGSAEYPADGSTPYSFAAHSTTGHPIPGHFQNHPNYNGAFH
ncbi:hypothetical protein PQX77_016542 [Marasmius sp. AFHP31]|nr:hypothetical protein PQX77_016542 [Marasmius sp. AFHP31]